MRRVLVVFVAVLALVALPSAGRAAASPCAGPAPMDCCAGMGEDGASPCHCSLNPVPPAPATLAPAAAPAVVLAEAPLPALLVEAPAAPRARAAPLFLLFSVLLV